MTHPTDNSPEKVEFAPNPIDIDQARFMDLLDPEHEELWDNFTEEVKQRERGHIAGVMFDLYLDPAVPQVFRDRAMIAALNQPSYKVFPREKFQDETTGNAERVRSYSSWIKDILVYQREAGAEFISSVDLLNRVKKLFNDELINEEEFEDLLIHADLQKTEPTHRYYIDDWDGHRRGVELNPERFLLLSDLLNARDKNGKLTPLTGTPLEKWALKQFSIWLEAQNNPEQTLPPWLATAGKPQAVRLCRQLMERLRVFNRSSKQDSILNWEYLGTALEYTGWEGIAVGGASGIFNDRIGLDKACLVEKKLGTDMYMNLIACCLKYRVPDRLKLTETIANEMEKDQVKSWWFDVWRETEIREDVLPGKTIALLNKAAANTSNETLLQNIEEEKKLRGLLNQYESRQALQESLKEEHRELEAEKALMQDPEFRKKKALEEAAEIQKRELEEETEKRLQDLSGALRMS